MPPIFRTLVILVALAPTSSAARSQQHPDLAESVGPLAGYPLDEWRDSGEIEEIRWDLNVERAALRMDQRIEVVYDGRIRARDLEPRDTAHDLYLKSWVRSRDTGAWVGESDPVRFEVEAGVPENVDIDFEMTLFVTPGDFDLVVLLVDDTTGRRSVGIERMEVDDPDDDWFPDAYAHVPIVEFPDDSWLSEPIEAEGSGNLVMPLVTTRPVDIEVIAMLSTPEQHIGSSYDEHQDNMQDALVALSQLDIQNGTMSAVGLDLVRRRQVFEQTDIRHLDTDLLDDALDEANQYAISLDDLMARMDNPIFLRDFVESEVEPFVGHDDPDAPLKVFLFLSGITRFDDDADVRKIRLGDDCSCLAFHIRIRLFLRDLFDQIEDVIEPLDPETYTITTPDDFRRAIGRVVRELEAY